MAVSASTALVKRAIAAGRETRVVIELDGVRCTFEPATVDETAAKKIASALPPKKQPGEWR